MADLLVRTLLRRQRTPRLSVLIYHRVLRAQDPLRPSEPTEAEFEARMHWLKSNFNVIPLAEGVAGLKSGVLPPRALAITFDDGYRDNHDLALPILARLGLPATFFVATGYLDGGCMFNDMVIEAVRAASGDVLDCGELGVHSIDSDNAKRAAIGAILDRVKYFKPDAREVAVRGVAEAAKAEPPHDLMMSSTQVTALHGAGMAIGGHTVTHPILSRVDIATARDEIDRGRRALEALVGSRVRLFAYPNGRPHLDYAAAHEGLVREAGFDGAVSTAHGAAATGANPYQIPRFTPWDREDWKFGLRLAANRMRNEYQTA